MNRTLAAFAAGTLACLGAFAGNPVIRTMYTSDPAPYVHGDKVYLFTDHDEDDATSFFKMKDWLVFSSDDMVNWKFLGAPLSLETFGWAKKDNKAWAAQAVERGGKWYWYVCCNSERGDSLGVAVADRAEGPYRDAIGKPLAVGGAFIDPTVFIDDDGKAYLFWGNKNCWYGELNDDMVSFKDGWRMVPGFDDEKCFGPKSKRMNWAVGREEMIVSYEEGPWVMKRNGVYYLSYAAGGVPEHMAYSTAPSIHGPWTYRGKIMDLADNSFTIHGGNIEFKGRSYMFYHNGKLPGGGGFRRSTCIEEFKWNDDGTIPFIPQTKEGPRSLREKKPAKNAPVAIEEREGKFTLEGSRGKLSAILRLPDDRREGARYPIAVLCHGFGADKGEHGGMFAEFADALARRGVASVRFDFNGHGESEGRMRDMTVPNEIEDAKRVVAWAASRKWSNGKVSILGHSQGGVVAAMTAGELGEAISRVVLLAPACVLKDDVRNGCTFGSRYDPKNPPEFVKLPGGREIGREFIKSAYDLPIFETARKFKGPVCLIHGTGDPIAKTRHVQEFHKDYARSELHLMDGDDHGLSRTFGEVREIAAEFISRDARFGVPLMPVVQTKYTADPAPIVRGGTVYLYTTHDEDDADGFKMRDWLLYTSTDMVNWRDCGAVASLADFAWARNKENGAWAIQVVERGGKWYMYCPLHGNGIGVLVADSPYGPFADPIGKPLVWQRDHWDDIDPTVFVDADGQAYMYWGNPNLYCVKLNEDMVSYSGEIMKLPKIKDYQEGPWFYKRGGWYYLAFASTCCPEGIGYAMSTSPLGPWRYMGHIMDHTPKTRGNHPGIVDFKGRSYCFGLDYDILRLQTSRHHERRSVSVQEMKYLPDGTIPELPYFKSGRLRQVEALDPFTRVEAETMAWGYGLKTEPVDRRAKEFWNQCVVNVDDTEHILVRGVDFDTGARSLTLSLWCLKPGATVEARLDSKDGPLAGAVTLAKADARFAEHKIALKGAKGVRDLYFVFRSGKPAGRDLLKFDWWRAVR